MHNMYKPRSLASEEPVLLIGVMGVTGSGKSSFARLASGDVKIQVGQTLKSCTKDVLASDVFEVDGCKVQLIDTPGFSDDELTDADVLDMIADWMKTSFDADQKLHGIMYLHRITDDRMDGGAVRSLKLFRNICGENFYQNTVMFTTMWDKSNDTTALERNEKELIGEHWKELISGGAMYARGYNKKEDCNEILSLIVQQQPMTAKLQEEVGYQGMEVGDTVAGAFLWADLGREVEKMKKIFEERYVKFIEESKTWKIEKELLMAKLNKLERDQELLKPKRARRKAQKAETSPCRGNKATKKESLRRKVAGFLGL